MFEQLINLMQKEPLAMAILITITIYIILRTTGLFDWLFRKIYGDFK